MLLALALLDVSLSVSLDFTLQGLHPAWLNGLGFARARVKRSGYNGLRPLIQ